MRGRNLKRIDDRACCHVQANEQRWMASKLPAKVAHIARIAVQRDRSRTSGPVWCVVRSKRNLRDTTRFKPGVGWRTVTSTMQPAGGSTTRLSRRTTRLAG